MDFLGTGHKCRYNESGTDGKVKEALMKRSGRAAAK